MCLVKICNYLIPNGNPMGFFVPRSLINLSQNLFKNDKILIVSNLKN